MRSIAFTLSAALLGLIQVTQAIDKVGIDNALKSHNEKRAKHGAPALKWNATLETYAQDWSNKCDFKHSGVNYYYFFFQLNYFIVLVGN